MKITILGTAPPLRTLKRGEAGTSLLVECDDSLLLIDCGPGAVSRLDGLGVDIRRIDMLLLTHHHWDHAADLPFFVLGRWEASQFGASGGKPFAPPLTLYGPAGTQRLLDRLFGADGAFAGDIATRLAPDIGVPLYGTRGIPAPFPPIMPAALEVKAGASWRVGPFEITTAAALHCQPYLESVAYRVATAAGAFVFSGDSAPSDDIARLARGADILFHECNMRSHVRAGLGRTALHSTPAEAAAIAAQAGARKLVAVHHGLAVEDEAGRAALRDALAAGFAGEIDIARSLASFEIGPLQRRDKRALTPLRRENR